MTEFKDFLIKKYGHSIVNNLMDEKGILDSRYIKVFGSGRLEVEEQIKILKSQNLLEQVLPNEGWAFDFPGWVGSFEKGNKEVMVIGLEPHIQNNDYQITYDLALDENGLLRKENRKMWSKIHKLFYPELEFETALNKFYVSDMCHFAPKGNANLISKIGNWKKIREEVASAFLIDEIEHVDPKIIVAQGKEVFRFLSKKSNSKVVDIPILAGYKRPITYSIQVFTSKGRKIIGTPHIGTRFNMVDGFWNNKLEEVRTRLLEV